MGFTQECLLIQKADLCNRGWNGFWLETSGFHNNGWYPTSVSPIAAGRWFHPDSPSHLSLSLLSAMTFWGSQKVTGRNGKWWKDPHCQWNIRRIQPRVFWKHITGAGEKLPRLAWNGTMRKMLIQNVALWHYWKLFKCSPTINWK